MFRKTSERDLPNKPNWDYENCDHFSITHSPSSLAMFWTIGRRIRKRGFVQF